MLREQMGDLLNGGIGRNGDDRGARSHHVANGFVTELDDRVDQFAIALFENAFVLTSLDEGIDRLGRVLGFFIRVFRTGERNDGLEEAEHERQRKDSPDEQAQQQSEADEPASARAREEQVRQKTVKDENDDDGEKYSLPQFLARPGGIAKYRVGQQKTNGRGEKLFEQGERERGALVGESEARLNLMLEEFN